MSDARKIAALVLAAGQSRRMGENKLLLPLDGKPMVRHTLDAIVEAGMGPAVVVVGYQAGKLREVLDGTGARLIYNPAYETGLASSLHAGVAALPADVDGAMVFLGDMPDIDVASVGRLAQTFIGMKEDAQRKIIVLLRNGSRGHPVLWGRAFFPALLTQTHGDAGAKELFARFSHDIVALDAGNDAVLNDIDTPDDYRRRVAG